MKMRENLIQINIIMMITMKYMINKINQSRTLIGLLRKKGRDIAIQCIAAVSILKIIMFKIWEEVLIKIIIKYIIKMMMGFSPIPSIQVVLETTQLASCLKIFVMISPKKLILVGQVVLIHKDSLVIQMKAIKMSNQMQQLSSSTVIYARDISHLDQNTVMIVGDAFVNLITTGILS